MTRMSDPGDAAKGLEEHITALAQISRSYAPEFSPHSKDLTFISDRSGLPEIWRKPLARGKARRLTHFTDPVQDYRWSPKGRWLAVQVAPGGGMNSQIHLIPPNSRIGQIISSGGESNNWLGGWLPDGSGILYISNQEDVATMHLYVYDVASAETRRITRAEGGPQGVFQLGDIIADGTKALLERVSSRSNSDVYFVDIETGQETLLTEHEGPGAYHNARFAPDAENKDTVYLSTDFERDKTAFCRVLLADDGTPGPIEILRGKDHAVLNWFTLAPTGGQALLCWSDAGRFELELLDLYTLAATPLAMPTELAFSARFRKDGRQFALYCNDADLAGDIWLYEFGAAAPERFTFSPHEGVDPSALVKPRLVRFPAHDGLELSGWLYEAAGPKPGPVVLHYHGGPEGQALPYYRYDFQALLASGISVFDPNVRGSSGFGKEFVNLDNGALRFNGVRDIESCVNFLLTEGIAEPGRLGIMGTSYGGYMTMAGLTEFPEIFAAGVNICGVVNFFTFFEQTEPWMAAISTVKYGDPATEAEMLRALSPIFQLERVQAATLVVHGANDTNVPVVEAEQVVTGLQERGVDCDYLLYPDEGHGITRLENKIDYTKALVQWFQRYLKAG